MNESQPVLTVYDDDHLESNDKRRTTNLQTLIHLLKGNIGPGCLSLPWAFSQLGIPLGIIATVFLAILTAYNSLSIISVKRAHLNQRSTSFGDLGGMAYGSIFRAFVTASLCIYQLSVCTVFFSFIGDNIASVALYLASNSTASSASSGNDEGTSDNNNEFTNILESSRFIMAVTLPFVMSLSYLPNLKVLAPVTAIGTFCLFVGFGLLGAVASLNWQNRPTDTLDIRWQAFPIAVSSIMYSFEGIILVLPVEAAMKTPENFVGIYILAMVIIVFTYTMFSALCVSAFGEVDDGSINAFLTKNTQNYVGDGLVIVSNIIVSFSVLFSYPLQLFPCIASLGQVRHRRSLQREDNCLPSEIPKTASHFIPIHTDNSNNHDTFTDSVKHVDINDESNLDQAFDKQSAFSSRSGLEGDSPSLRAILVVITFFAAFAVPNVQELISLAGAFAGTSMALVIPPLIKLSVIPENVGSWDKMKCWVLIIFGSFLGIAGTVASIVEIFNSGIN